MDGGKKKLNAPIAHIQLENLGSWFSALSGQQLTQENLMPREMLSVQNSFKGLAGGPAVREWGCPWSTSCALSFLAMRETKNS